MSEQTNIIGNKDFNVSKILKQGRVTIPGLASPSINTTALPMLYVDVEHNFGFIPTFQCYAEVANIQWWSQQLQNVVVQMPIGYFEYESGATTNYYNLIALADKTKLRIYNNWTSYAATYAIPAINVIYRIYEDTA
jgi:hypothetical protein